MVVTLEQALSQRPTGTLIYINGDSWMAGVPDTAIQDHVVVNRAVRGDDNTNIVKRSHTDADLLSRHGWDVKLVIGLSELGRDQEHSLGAIYSLSETPLHERLHQAAVWENDRAAQALDAHDRYVFRAWTNNSLHGNLNVLDFLDLPHDVDRPYCVSQLTWKWLIDHQRSLKLNRRDLVEAMDVRDRFKTQVLQNQYIDQTLHVRRSLAHSVYSRFMRHVLEMLGVKQKIMVVQQ